jgi:hypothetical protein
MYRTVTGKRQRSTASRKPAFSVVNQCRVPAIAPITLDSRRTTFNLKARRAGNEDSVVL